MDVRELQRQRLRSTVDWAHKLRGAFQHLLESRGATVHFRPSSTGVTMIGLLPDRPQRGKSGVTNLTRLVANFETEFAACCRDVPHGRVTGEKALQSLLISQAQTNARRLLSINEASAVTDDPVELLFVTDEIALPVEGGKIVCDLLALRRDGGRATPVLLELKDSRMLTRLVAQVNSYARLIDDHADLFAELFGALLGERIAFDAPTEKWIVWPAAATGADPQEGKLRTEGIRVVGYDVTGNAFTFSVGRKAR